MRSAAHHRCSVWKAVGAILFGGVLGIGCADAPRTPVELDAEASRTGQAVDRLQELDLGPALQAQERHGAALMRIPGVVGHGVGVDDDGDPTITVFTLTPGVSGIPSRLDDVRTRTVVSGQFVAGELTSGVRPAPSGYSIGHPDITAGTLGAVVQDGGDVCYVLSNNHVLANSNDANIGDSALQPGPFDGGSDPDDAIGTLADFEPIAFDGSTNTIDAAIAEVFAPVEDFVTGRTPDFIPTSNPAAATVGQDVKKTGRTTEFTTGDVTEIHVSVNVCYECAGPFCFNCKKIAHFENQFATTDMSDGGDSGSLIVDTGDNPVGLLFAGSDTRTIANPIGAVLERFGAEVIQPADLGSCSNGDNSGPGDNSAPTADFTFTASELTVDFTDQSSDSDGSVIAWSWDFGDGSTSTAQNPSHTYASDDTYTVSLTVTDDDGATGSTSQDVTVSSSTATVTHVGDLDAVSINDGSTWTAEVTVIVHDENHAPVSGFAVTGSWSGAGSGEGDCTTDTNGQCTVSRSGIHKSNGSVSYSVTGDLVTSDNHDPDADSDGTSITVGKP